MIEDPKNQHPPEDVGADAVSVGIGIPRRDERITSPVSSVQAPPPVVDVWLDKPSVQGQINNGQEFWKLDRVEVLTYDLRDVEQLAAYNTLITRASIPDSSVLLVSNVRQWDPEFHNWMACVEVHHILYRKLIK